MIPPPLRRYFTRNDLLSITLYALAPLRVRETPTRSRKSEAVQIARSFHGPEFTSMGKTPKYARSKTVWKRIIMNTAIPLQ
jgi:hypothetical protein